LYYGFGLQLRGCFGAPLHRTLTTSQDISLPSAQYLGRIILPVSDWSFADEIALYRAKPSPGSTALPIRRLSSRGSVASTSGQRAYSSGVGVQIGIICNSSRTQHASRQFKSRSSECVCGDHCRRLPLNVGVWSLTASEKLFARLCVTVLPSCLTPLSRSRLGRVL
jgi:hypothetical protein